MLEYVKKYFPLWATYLDSDEDDLQNLIDLAYVELKQYINIDTAALTDQQKRFILILVKKECFDVKNGDVEFENKPRIVRDYETLVKTLKDIRAGEIGETPSTESEDEDQHVSISAKDRKFNEWFI